MNKTTIGLLAVFGTLAALFASRSLASSRQDAASSGGYFPDFPVADEGFGYGAVEDFFNQSGADTMANWKVNEYPKYANAIREAENRYGIPRDLLGRTLYQESRFRPDIISGEKRSPVGAQGIGQFMPATAAEYGLTDRTDPFASIDAAGRYLRDLYRMFGNWQSALMAYNWGPGNVQKYNRGENVTVPMETSTYVAQITADVPVA